MAQVAQVALSPLQLNQYLQRIQYSGSLKTDLRTLAALQCAHQRAIPFGNFRRASWPSTTWPSPAPSQGALTAATAALLPQHEAASGGRPRHLGGAGAQL